MNDREKNYIDNIHLNDCIDCCDDKRVNIAITPTNIDNILGLSSLKYRVGTHSKFKSSMISRLSDYPALDDLKYRADDDLAISILDSWATIADVLTFYQERIANEGFLRTATERRSILELARAVGYELKPGVAASTYLAFTLEDAPGAVEKTVIDIGTKVQSLPGQGELPQIFETVEKIEARPEWNNLSPQLNRSQDLNESLKKKTLFLSGTSTKLKTGDGLLVITNGNTKFNLHFLNIINIKLDTKFNLSQIDFEIKYEQAYNTLISMDTSKNTTNAIKPSDILDKILDQKEPRIWTGSELEAYLLTKNYPLDDLVNTVNHISQQPLPNDILGVYALRTQASIFGHNAPDYNTLANETKDNFKNKCTPHPNLNFIYNGWDDPTTRYGINVDSCNIPYATKLIYLDNRYASILPNTFIILQNAGTTPLYSFYKIRSITDATLSDFLLTARVTGINLETLDSKDVIFDSNFELRKTSVYAQSEQLEIAKLPIDPIEEPLPCIDDDNKITYITLDRMVGRLCIGQAISIKGELIDQPGIIKSEIAIISQITHFNNFENNEYLTKLEFVDKLSNTYKRDTVKINANVANATHGETKNEVLGSGNPSQQQQQKFTLKQKPLTFISASTANGIESTLYITIDDIMWNEVKSLYNAKDSDRVYTTQINDDSNTLVIFGDGINGAHPSAGIENIKAKYRIGIGISGLLKEDQVTLLMSRPLGVRSVTNPNASSGAANSENLDQARTNAPNTVLTVDRLVSFKDFANFALSFAGIGKTQSTRLWINGKWIVHLTIASTTGEIIGKNSNLYKNLVNSIDTFKDPMINYMIDSFKPILFNIEAKILVEFNRQFDFVKSNVEAYLQKGFSFQSRDFGQVVTASEVISKIQGVEGVQAVYLTALYPFESVNDASKGKTKTLFKNYLYEPIPSNIAHLSNIGQPLPAELLTLNPTGIIITEMKIK